MEEGLAADADGDKERAAQLFRRSLEIHPSYDVAGNLGLIEFRMEDYASAANHLSYCLRHFASGQKRELRELIEAKLVAARQYVAELSVRATETGAEILIDDVSVGRTPLDHPIFVTPGKHLVEVRKGSLRAVRAVAVESGETRRVDVGPLGKATSSSPAYAGEAPSARSGPPLWPAAALGGVALGAVATSVVFRVLADSAREDLSRARAGYPEDACQDPNAPAVCADIARSAADYQMRADVADATLVVGGSLAGVALGYVTYVLLAKRSRARAVQLDAALGAQGGQLMIRGKF